MHQKAGSVRHRPGGGFTSSQHPSYCNGTGFHSCQSSSTIAALTAVTVSQAPDIQWRVFLRINRVSDGQSGGMGGTSQLAFIFMNQGFINLGQ